MKQRIFDSMVSQKKRSGKWLFMIFSVLFHGLLLSAVVVGPLMDAMNNIPEAKVVTVFMTGPPPPPEPMIPVNKGKKPRRKPGPVKVGPKKPAPANQQVFAPPMEIPTTIPEEDMDSLLDSYSGEYIPGAPTGLEQPEGAAIWSSSQAVENEPLMEAHVVAPRLVRRVSPTYPTIAQNAKIQGIVSVEAITDIYGRVTTARVLGGHPLLRDAALRAVRQWVYEPYIVNGLPKPVKFIVSINFRLGN